MRILICEDERELNKIISQKLTKEGYSVDSCHDGEESLLYIQSTQYDLIILDIMMPKLNGHDVVKAMRNKNIDYPVLFLSAKDSVEDIVNGLDLGANDYVVKPFSFDELLARIRVLIRTKPKNNNNLIKLHDLTLNLNTREATRNNEIISLTSREYAILEYMLHNVNIVLTKEQIEEHIWNYEYEGGTSLVKVYIRYLRKKIDDPYDLKLIHTIRGVGYVIRGELE